MVALWYSEKSSDNSAGKHHFPLAIFFFSVGGAHCFFDSSVKTFDFRIDLGSVGRDFSMYNTILGKICTKLGGGELWAIVGNMYNFMRHRLQRWSACILLYCRLYCRRGTFNNMYFWPSGTGICHERRTFSTGKWSTQVGVQGLPWLIWHRHHVKGQWCGYWTLGVTCNAVHVRIRCSTA